jgi:hypothetical protein
MLALLDAIETDHMNALPLVKAAAAAAWEEREAKKATDAAEREFDLASRSAASSFDQLGMEDQATMSVDALGTMMRIASTHSLQPEVYAVAAKKLWEERHDTAAKRWINYLDVQEVYDKLGLDQQSSITIDELATKSNAKWLAKDQQMWVDAATDVLALNGAARWPHVKATAEWVHRSKYASGRNSWMADPPYYYNPFVRAVVWATDPPVPPTGKLGIKATLESHATWDQTKGHVLGSLSREQHIHFHNATDGMFGTFAVFQQRALELLGADADLRPLLPDFVLFIVGKVTDNKATNVLGDLPKLELLMNFVRTLLVTPHLTVTDLEPHVWMIASAVLKCIVGASVCSNPLEDHWSLRRVASTVIVTIATKFGHVEMKNSKTLSTLISDVMHDALSNCAAKSLAAHFGAITVLVELKDPKLNELVAMYASHLQTQLKHADQQVREDAKKVHEILTATVDSSVMVSSFGATFEATLGGGNAAAIAATMDDDAAGSDDAYVGMEPEPGIQPEPVMEPEPGMEPEPRMEPKPA